MEIDPLSPSSGRIHRIRGDIKWPAASVRVFCKSDYPHCDEENNHLIAEEEDKSTSIENPHLNCTVGPRGVPVSETAIDSNHFDVVHFQDWGRQMELPQHSNLESLR